MRRCLPRSSRALPRGMSCPGVESRRLGLLLLLELLFLCWFLRFFTALELVSGRNLKISTIMCASVLNKSGAAVWVRA
jgi:hypothetical protein